MEKCRFCGSKKLKLFLDLGMSPLSNSFIKSEYIFAQEKFFSLTSCVCEECFLVQLGGGDLESPANIFSDYVYFSSYSASWLQHARQYTDKMLEVLPNNSYVVEIASNDGYLLQYFVEKNVRVLGIEPAKNVAKVARDRGINTISEFFGKELAKKLLATDRLPDLIVGNNVLAHVPDINDFVSGLKILLKEDGIITLEFPHLLELITKNQYDTIYHEHFSYLSLGSVKKILSAHGLKIYDVEQLTTHGGSLRLFVGHEEDGGKTVGENVKNILAQENQYGLFKLNTYDQFVERVQRNKRDLLSLLIEIKNSGKNIVGYGAAAKGNTLLNYCGIRTDIIDYIADKNPHKQNLYTPGTHIPVVALEQLMLTKPDYIFILPWNIKEEVMEQLSFAQEWGAKFIVAIPNVEVLDNDFYRNETTRSISYRPRN